jgi:hypothetical protein
VTFPPVQLQSESEDRVRIRHAGWSHPEAKIWIDPSVELALNHGLSARQIATAIRIVEKHHDDIREAWATHFGS